MTGFRATLNSSCCAKRVGLRRQTETATDWEAGGSGCFMLEVMCGGGIKGLMLSKDVQYQLNQITFYLWSRSADPGEVSSVHTKRAPLHLPHLTLIPSIIPRTSAKSSSARVSSQTPLISVRPSGVYKRDGNLEKVLVELYHDSHYQLKLTGGYSSSLGNIHETLSPYSLTRRQNTKRQL